MSKLASNEALFRDDRFWSQYTRVRLTGMDQIHAIVVRNDKAAELEAAGLVRVLQIR
jgi:hypothetical protein